MTELLLNDNPLDRLSKRLLDQEKASASPDYPYSLQLVAWVLGEHPNEAPLPDPDYEASLLSQVNVMYGFKKVSLVLQNLVNADPGLPLRQALSAEARSLRGKSAQDAGNALVENLFDNLSQALPSLRLPANR